MALWGGDQNGRSQLWQLEERPCKQREEQAQAQRKPTCRTQVGRADEQRNGAEKFREAGYVRQTDVQALKGSRLESKSNGNPLKGFRLVCAFMYVRPDVFKSPLWKPSLQLPCGKDYWEYKGARLQTLKCLSTYEEKLLKPLKCQLYIKWVWNMYFLFFTHIYSYINNSTTKQATLARDGI